MKFMKIVAIGAYVFVQTSNYRNRDYTQTIMKIDEFEKFMQEQFPKYWDEYMWDEYLNYYNNVDRQFKKTAPEYFYHYGETEEMRRKGEAYIYTK